MPWPQATDYTAAVQNPTACFTDPALASAVPETNLLLGTPLSWCGSFAIVFKVVTSCGETWAVKCFIREVTDHRHRYSLLSQHLDQNRKRFAVEFGYQNEGILVGGTAYPLVKMRWVEGDTLNEFLDRHAGNAFLLDQLANLWLRLAGEMREIQMAHGDLQHGNALLMPGKHAGSLVLRLVDYDGMWVPALEGQPPGERGHANYQHPQRLREGGYSAEIDRFAHLSIYTGLRCLAAGGKELWTKHDNGDNLLFREADFAYPEKSRLWPEVLESPDPAAARLAAHLAHASQEPLEAVPLLSDLVSARGAVAPLRPEQRDKLGSLFPAVKAFRKAMPPLPAFSPDWLPPDNVPLPAPRPLSAPLLPELPPLPATIPAEAQEVPLSSMEAGPALEEIPAHPVRRRRRRATPPSALVLASMLGTLTMLAASVWWFWPPPAERPTFRYEGKPPSATVRAGRTAEVSLRFVWEGEEPLSLALRLEGPALLNARLLSQEADSGGITCRVRVAPPRHAEKGAMQVRAVLSSDGADVAQTTARFQIEPGRVRLGDIKPVVLCAGSSAVIEAVIFSDDSPEHLIPALSHLPDKVGSRSFRIRPDGKMSLVLAAAPEAEEATRTVTLLLRDGARAVARTSFSVAVVPASSPLLKPVSVAGAADRKLELSGPETLVLDSPPMMSASLALKRINLPGKVTILPERLPPGVRIFPATTEGDKAEIEIFMPMFGPPFRGKATVRLVAMQGTVRLASWDLALESPPAGGNVAAVMHRAGEPLPARQITFPTADGLTLAGKLWPVRRPRDANTVLLLPDARRAGGLGGRTTKLALALQKEGCSVFALEFRGQGANRFKGAAVPGGFYNSCRANKLLQQYQSKGRRTAASRASPPLEALPAWYAPWLVQDLIAARAYLDVQHDEGAVNSQNLIVVALGESAHLASLWLCTETLRTGGVRNATPESKDVRAILLVGASAFGKTWTARSEHLGFLARSGNLPPVHAITDAAHTGAGLQLANLLRRTGIPANSTTTARGKALACGHALLALDGMTDLVVQKVMKMPRTDWRPWTERDYTSTNYYWTLRAFQDRAKLGGDKTPQLCPLQKLGFPTLSSYKF